MCIHLSLRKQKCRLKSTTTNGCRHFGQLEQRKPSVLFPIQSEKSPDSGFFTCDPTKKCIMPYSRERLKGIIGRGHDLRLSASKLSYLGVPLARLLFTISPKWRACSPATPGSPRRACSPTPTFPTPAGTNNRAVYTRENKPRLTIAAAYIRREHPV